VEVEVNWVRVLAWAGLATLVLAGLQWWTNSIEARGYERGSAAVQSKWDQADLARARATLRQSEVNREEEARREAAKQKEIANAQEQRRTAVAAAARADRAADGLRGQLAAFVADARSGANVPSHPGVAGRVETAAPPIVVLADLFGRADALAGELAKAVDAAHGAGLSCERSMDALTP
jgi:hypothetical protein